MSWFRGFRGCWRLLTGIWHLHLDLDVITGFWYTHDPNFGSLSLFWRCKEHPCPLSSHFGLWRILEVPDWGWHLDLGLDMVINLAWINPEVLITLRSVEVQIQSVKNCKRWDKLLDKLVPGGSGLVGLGFSKDMCWLRLSQPTVGSPNLLYDW